MLNCHEALVKCDGDLSADPDVGGVGTLVAFTVSAWLSAFLTVFSYWFNLVPDELLNNYDRLFSRRASNGSPKWRRVAQNTTMALSDQQIVTGIAVLVAAFSQLHVMSVYHWHVAVYLAWMSSSVHLTSLTYLRFHLERTPVMRTWRLIGMLVLFWLLFAALYPTSGSAFICVLQRNEEDCSSRQLPSRCFWSPQDVSRASNDPASSSFCFKDKGISPDSVLAYTFLTVSYAWKASMLFPRSRGMLHEWIRSRPLWLLEKPLRRLASPPRPLYKKLIYVILLTAYIPILAVSDLAQSFAGSIWALSIGLIWGTLQLIYSRLYVSSLSLKEENMWNFGQVLPMLLLAMPLVIILGDVYGENEAKPSYLHSEAIERDYQLTRHNEDQHDLNDVPLQPDSDDRDLLDHRNPPATPSTSVSSLFRQLDPESPVTRQRLHHIFYQSKTFRAILVLVNLAVLGLAAMVDFYAYWSVGGFYFLSIYTLVFGVIVMGGYCLVAAFWSRLYR